MGFRLPSYQPNGDSYCPHGFAPAEPCWGKVERRDEDCTEDYSDCWCYMQCEARDLCHTVNWWRGYKQSPYNEDQNATVTEDDE